MPKQEQFFQDKEEAAKRKMAPKIPIRCYANNTYFLHSGISDIESDPHKKIAIHCGVGYSRKRARRSSNHSKINQNISSVELRQTTFTVDKTFVIE